ncbi:oligosaccharyl transferase, archaeosortase A system-associated [Methanofollis fontis]|uniref:dolichyl-phosphooligosaccharide-protein glycotransferase n=1 Tax=Methanofollis fontis TaxID=2052832 RepID=A0A483CZ99_9EURY|nr:oligosaccharyl transferase, archaeosortase A system-associated [Methanofollis fontis]TAJ45652.1 oligosaccharyl transferase, archaeosortase A system-associated [Methanofollis fontis]
MPPFDNKQKSIIIAAAIILFSIIALWIRLIPMGGLMAEGVADVLGNDPWYNLRQVESLVANGLTYAWYDPMTLFPTGDTVYWGPLFPQIIAVLVILSGATTRPEVAYVASLVPALMGAAMVPLVYGIGRKMADWKTGLIAAGFTAVVSGQFMYRSLFGFVDHHIAEVLFSTLFVLAYIVALGVGRQEKPDLQSFETLRRPLVFGAAAGIAYLLGLLVMPTMILFAMITALYTVVQFVLDAWNGRESTDLALINTAVFAVATVGLLLFGFKEAGMGLSRYSMGHLVAYLAIIIGTWALFGLARAMRERPKYVYPLSLAGIGIIGALILMVAAPGVYSVLVGSFFSFFGQSAVVLTVQEAMGWSTGGAWQAFSTGLVLMIGGFAVLAYMILRKERADHLFVLVWSAIMLASTWQHVRYEYYLAVNIALLSGICVGFVLNLAWKDILALGASPTPEPTAGKGKKKAEPARKPRSATADPRHLLAVGAVVVLSCIFVALSLQTGLAIAEGSSYGGMNPQWRQALDWMGESTPDTGVDYLGVYERSSYTYPESAYGVMSWWDYGHWITYLAQRIPNANPFQHGVTGPNGSASFFMAQDEDVAAEIMDNDGTRYVITDIEMDTGKFWAMATWFDPDRAAAGYIDTFLVPDQSSGSYNQAKLYTGEYFTTMIGRLHNLDGSLAEPSQVIYAEYTDAGTSGYSVPTITTAEVMDGAAAQAKADAFNANAAAGRHAGLFGSESNLALTPVEVPALQHFRLVFESSQNVYNAQTPDIRYVKIFEYVPGAHIRGEGTIEIDLITNGGRSFTYRQTSTDGEFIVPYATSGGTSGVTASGPYRILESGRTVDVPESAVMQGLTIGQ